MPTHHVALLSLSNYLPGATGLVLGGVIGVLLSAGFGGFFFPVAVAAIQGLKQETSKVHATNFGV